MSSLKVIIIQWSRICLRSWGHGDDVSLRPASLLERKEASSEGLSTSLLVATCIPATVHQTTYRDMIRRCIIVHQSKDSSIGIVILVILVILVHG